VCVTVQLDDCVALAQQHGEQSALRKGLGHNVVSFSKRLDNFRRDSVHSCDRFAMNLGGLSRERPYPKTRALLRGRHPIPSNFAVLTHCI
jgi:hypothetical protein